MLPGPTAPSEGSAGVRDLDPKNPKAPKTRPRSWRTSSGVAFHRGGPKTRFLVRFSSRKSLAPQFPSAWPEGFCDLDVPRPFLGWVPSTRPVSLGGKPPSYKEAPALPAPLADWSGNPFAASSPREAVQLRTSFHRLPAEIGPSVALRFLPAVSGSPGRWGLPSRSRIERAQRIRVAQSEKCGPEPVDNGDIGRNSRFGGRDSTHHGESRPK